MTATVDTSSETNEPDTPETNAPDTEPQPFEPSPTLAAATDKANRLIPQRATREHLQPASPSTHAEGRAPCHGAIRVRAPKVGGEVVNGKIAVLLRCQVQDISRTSFRVGVEKTTQRHHGRRVYKDTYGERFVIVEEER